MNIIRNCIKSHKNVSTISCKNLGIQVMSIYIEVSDTSFWHNANNVPF